MPLQSLCTLEQALAVTYNGATWNKNLTMSFWLPVLYHSGTNFECFCPNLLLTAFFRHHHPHLWPSTHKHR